MPLTELLEEALAQPLTEALRRMDTDAEGHPECEGLTDVERVKFTVGVARADSDGEEDSEGLREGEGDTDAEARPVREPAGERLAEKQLDALKEVEPQGVPEGVLAPLRDNRGDTDTVVQPVLLFDGSTEGVAEAVARGEALTEGDPLGEGEPRAEPVGGTTVTEGHRVAEAQGDAECDATGEVDCGADRECDWLPLLQGEAEGVSPPRVEEEGLPLAVPGRGVALGEDDTEGLVLTERLPPPVALMRGEEDTLAVPVPLAEWEGQGEALRVTRIEGEGVAQRVAEGEGDAEPDTEGLCVLRSEAEGECEHVPLRVGATLEEGLPDTLTVGAAFVGDTLGEPLKEGEGVGVRQEDAEEEGEKVTDAHEEGDAVPRVLRLKLGLPLSVRLLLEERELLGEIVGEREVATEPVALVEGESELDTEGELEGDIVPSAERLSVPLPLPHLDAEDEPLPVRVGAMEPLTEELPDKLAETDAQREAEGDVDCVRLPLPLPQPLPVMDAEREALAQRDNEGDTEPEKDKLGDAVFDTEPDVLRVGGAAVALSLRLPEEQPLALRVAPSVRDTLGEALTEAGAVREAEDEVEVDAVTVALPVRETEGEVVAVTLAVDVREKLGEGEGEPL